MRKIYFQSLLLFLFLASLKNGSNAQNVHTTNAPDNCELNCVIPGWVNVPNVLFTYRIGNPNCPDDCTMDWVNGGGDEVIQPLSPSGGAGVRWLSIRVPSPESNKDNGAYSEISGLKPGKTYTLSYHVLSGRGKFSYFGEYVFTDYGKSATLWVTNGANVITKKTLTFGNGLYNKWILQDITFVAPSDKVRITFTGESYDNEVDHGGFICLDLAGSSALVQVCDLSANQVSLVNGSANQTLYCANQTANLNTAFQGAVPSGTQLLWFDNPSHSGAPIAFPSAVGPGIYYAFFKDLSVNCYNVVSSNASVTVTRKLPALTVSSISNTCPAQTVNLNSALLEPAPSGYRLHWFTNNNHTGEPVANPLAAVTGFTYYPFLYNVANECYTANSSLAQLQAVANPACPPCNAGGAQAILSQQSVNFCSGSTVNLNSYFTGNLPVGTSLVWYLNATHTYPAVKDPTKVGLPGVYYAFIYDSQNSCFNTAASTAKVTVKLNSTAQVSLPSQSTNPACPATTANLTKFYQGIIPEGATLVWYNTADHSGSIVTDPSEAPAGTYYAFFHYGGGCYNTDNSTAKVTVTINQCADKVQLSVKVNLQGGMHANLPQMRNDLQTYFGNSQGLLPETDPYGSGLFVPNINNIVLSAEVVDWIKVEVRSAANPLTILESQSLFLRPNGNITNADNTTPKFTPQAEPVRIVLKHRNHVAIMSNSISTFGVGPVSYDFTTALAQAYNDGSVPDQMKLVNGVWSMVVGDVGQDLIVDNVDVSVFNPSFNKGDFDIYTQPDLNMDGIVDNVDVSFFNNSFNAGYFSILINY